MENSQHQPTYATRHATSLQRPMRQCRRLSPYAHWSQKRLAARMGTSLRAIPHSRGIRWLPSRWEMENSQHQPTSATRHATSLQRQMRPTPPLSPYAHWSQNRLADRMGTSLRGIPHSRGIRGATFAMRNGEFTTPTNKRDAARHVATKADAPYTAPITLRALESKSPSRPHGN